MSLSCSQGWIVVHVHNPFLVEIPHCVEFELLSFLFKSSPKTDSTDDDKIMSYQWEEIEGPVREQKITGDTQTLKLTDLVPGSYVISLTVTDADGATDSALANVTVKEETDNPPVAKAGKDVIIKLPVNSAILYGNSSFDDHPNVAYEWSKVSGPVADMSVRFMLTIVLQQCICFRV